MIRNVSIGIDIGSETTRVVVGEFSAANETPKIIGAGEAPSVGVRRGYIVDANSAVNSIKQAVAQAEKSAGIKIRRAYISISGVSLKSENSGGEAVVSKANGEVTTLDINRVLQDCEDNLNLNNKKVVQVYPLSFKLDGKDILGRLEGMHGTKLEGKAVFITYSSQHLEDLLGIVARAGVETVDVVPTPIALSNIVLSEKQKIVGVALVDIGAEKTSLSVFENGSLIHTHTFPIGSSDITNDIALGFKIPLEKAEELKLGNVPTTPAGAREEFSKKKLEEIIEARLDDIFESIENNLKKIKRSELLPAGIIFVGGGANIHKISELSKAALKLPSSVGGTEMFGAAKTRLRDPAWLATVGLLISGKNDEEYSENSFGGLFKNLKSIIKSSIKQLMP